MTKNSIVAAQPVNRLESYVLEIRDTSSGIYHRLVNAPFCEATAWVSYSQLAVLDDYVGASPVWGQSSDYTIFPLREFIQEVFGSRTVRVARYTPSLHEMLIATVKKNKSHPVAAMYDISRGPTVSSLWTDFYFADPIHRNECSKAEKEYWWWYSSFCMDAGAFPQVADQMFVDNGAASSYNLLRQKDAVWLDD